MICERRHQIMELDTMFVEEPEAGAEGVGIHERQQNGGKAQNRLKRRTDDKWERAREVARWGNHALEAKLWSGVIFAHHKFIAAIRKAEPFVSLITA